MNVVWVVEIGLVFERGAKITRLQSEQANILPFCVGGPNWLVPVWMIELDSTPVQDEMDFVVVWVVENDVISVWLIGVDLVFVQRSKMTGFSCRGIDIDLRLEWLSKVTEFW